MCRLNSFFFAHFEKNNIVRPLVVHALHVWHYERKRHIAERRARKQKAYKNHRNIRVCNFIIPYCCCFLGRTVRTEDRLGVDRVRVPCDNKPLIPQRGVKAAGKSLREKRAVAPSCSFACEMPNRILIKKNGLDKMSARPWLGCHRRGEVAVGMCTDPSNSTRLLPNFIVNEKRKLP